MQLLTRCRCKLYAFCTLEYIYGKSICKVQKLSNCKLNRGLQLSEMHCIYSTQQNCWLWRKRKKELPAVAVKCQDISHAKTTHLTAVVEFRDETSVFLLFVVTEILDLQLFKALPVPEVLDEYGKSISQPPRVQLLVSYSFTR